jgi:hypothetical protein
MIDTSTEAGRDKRMSELAEGYRETGNRVGLVRLIGGSVNDFNDYIPGQDDGEPPQGAKWN